MTLGSLFDGISGFPLAASWCGIETKWISEIDPYCLKVSKKNFQNAKQYGDIKEIRHPEYVDIISGGFPCQPFSVAGDQLGESDPRFLWPEMFRVISEVKPKYVIGENVPGINKVVLERICSDLENQGYITETFIIPACSVNASHNRARVWIIAYSNSIHISRRDSETKEERETKIGRIETLVDIQDGATIPKPEFLRNYDGVPRRMDRIKALGNAIVPQLAHEIFKAIIEIENV
jgi:DNA (cytosine-5)-methyltransferase 1